MTNTWNEIKAYILPNRLKYNKHETKMTCLQAVYEPNRAIGKTFFLCLLWSLNCWLLESFVLVFVWIHLCEILDPHLVWYKLYPSLLHMKSLLSAKDCMHPHVSISADRHFLSQRRECHATNYRCLHWTRCLFALEGKRLPFLYGLMEGFIM